jgi:hypothetical protein
VDTRVSLNRLVEACENVCDGADYPDPVPNGSLGCRSLPQPGGDVYNGVESTDLMPNGTFAYSSLKACEDVYNGVESLPRAPTRP